jgi:hypothetical protein
VKKLSIAAALALSASLVSTGSANAAVASGSANASIVAAIAISNSVPLNFGQIAPTIAIGSVTVATTGARTFSGGVTLANGTPATAASFAVTGAPLNAYTITLPADVDVTLTGPGAPMTVTGFVSNPPTSGTLSAGGTQTLLVGATVNVGVSQVAGAYTGLFNVGVVYN